MLIGRLGRPCASDRDGPEGILPNGDVKSAVWPRGFAFRDLDGLFAYFETVMMEILYFHSTNTYINFYVLKLVKSLSRLIF